MCEITALYNSWEMLSAEKLWIKKLKLSEQIPVSVFLSCLSLCVNAYSPWLRSGKQSEHIILVVVSEWTVYSVIVSI